MWIARPGSRWGLTLQRHKVLGGSLKRRNEVRPETLIAKTSWAVAVTRVPRPPWGWTIRDAELKPPSLQRLE